METFKEYGNTGYFVSNYGNIKSKYGKLLKPQATGVYKKYLQVRIFDGMDKKGQLYYVHRLVAKCHIGEIPTHYTVHHVDHNPHNNHVSNLRIVTLEDNIIEYLTCEDCNPNYKLTPEKVREIRNHRKTPAKVFADKFNVNIFTIYRVRQGTTWAFVQ